MCLTGPGKVEQLAKKVDLPGPGGEAPEGAIVAWRVWHLRSGTKPRLRSTYADGEWAPKKAMKTHKTIAEDGEHVGVHAVAEPKDLSAVGNFSAAAKQTVIGQVLLWGKVARHESGVKGFRAEYGYPLKLFTNDPRTQVALRDEYNCAVMRLSAKNFIERKQAA